jgi:hypothetical protein
LYILLHSLGIWYTPWTFRLNSSLAFLSICIFFLCGAWTVLMWRLQILHNKPFWGRDTAWYSLPGRFLEKRKQDCSACWHSCSDAEISMFYICLWK